MNSEFFRSIRRFAALAVVVAGCSFSSATTVVFSNLVPTAAGNASRLVDSKGAPLGIGSWVGLGYFGTLSPAEIAALAQEGKDALLAAFTPYGAASTIGTGTAAAAGRIEFAGNATLSQPQGGLHVVIFNAATPAAATEMLVAALPGIVPADDASGLIGYMAVHLEDATLLVGTQDANGIATASLPGGFDVWMADQNQSGLSSAELLPEADADHDGVPNLVEYALGSLACDPASHANVDPVVENGIFRLRFLGRNDDPDLKIQVESTSDPGSSSWMISTEPIVEMLPSPSPAPSGHVWLQVDLPASGNRKFARVRVSLIL